MPDDPMFPAADPAALPPDPVADPSATPPNGAPDPALQAYIQQAANEMVQSVTQDHQRDMQTMRAQLETAQSQIVQLSQQRTAQPDPTPEPPLDNETFINKLAESPQDTIAGIVRDELRTSLEGVGPIFNQLHSVAQNALTLNHQTEFDKKFGPGAFDEEVLPLLESRIKQESQQRPLIASDQAWINTEIEAIKGHRFDSLTERQAKYKETRASEENKAHEDIVNRVVNTTTLGSGGFPDALARAKGPNPEHEEFLARRAAAGGAPVSFDDLKRAASSDSLDEFNAQKEGAA